MATQQTPQAVRLTSKGLALCDFAFRDGPHILGLSADDAMAEAKRLIEKWDGSETLLQMYQRTEQWPDEIEKPSSIG